jgi:hypothetical protein
MRASGNRKKQGARVTCVVTCVVSCVVTALASAAEGDPPSAYTHAADAPAKNAFSLAYAVRPWAPPDLLRIDSAFLLSRAQSTSVPTLTVGARVVRDLGIYVRGAIVANTRDDELQRSGIGNPALFALFTPEVAAKTRVPFVLAVAVPLGEGGGDAPDSDVRAAVGAGVYARQAMDNALFATNYVTTAVGAGVSRVDRGWTLQVEATFFQLFRARGGAMDAERTRSNLTSGLNVGYALTDFLNLNVEAHYQRWLSTPAIVQKDSAFRDQLTVGGGVRFTVVLENGVALRPGVGYFRGIDAPMGRNGAHIVQIDLPIVL